MRNRMRCNSAEYSRNTFYQLPKFLFTSEFKGMSYGAKVLYALLKDRHELSVTNGWENEKGDFYLIMSRDEMCELLEITLKTIIKLINEIKKYDLMEEERRGLGKPNLIYILQVKTCKISTPRPVKNTGQDMENFHANDTYRNQTDFNDISLRARGKAKSKGTKPANNKKQGSFNTNEFYQDALNNSYESIDKKADKK